MGDVSSGMTLLLNTPDLLSDGNDTLIDLYEDGKNPVNLKKENWGFYHILRCRATWKNLEWQKTALVGEDIFEQEPVGLYLADHKKYLSVAGDTRLSGNCYLPALGIRRAYIEGEGYKGEKLVYGKIKTSNSQLPKINAQLIHSVSKYLKGNFLSSDSLLDYREISYRSPVVWSFNNKSLVYSSKDALLLSQLDVEGRVIFYSEQSIFVTADNNLEQVIIVAPKVLIADDFKGSIQVFAADSIVIGKNCSLDFPGFVAIINNNINSCYLQVGESSTIRGGLMICKKRIARNLLRSSLPKMQGWKVRYMLKAI